MISRAIFESSTHPKNTMKGSIYTYRTSHRVEAELTGIVNVFIPARSFGDRDIIYVPFGENHIAVPKNVPKGVCYGSSIGKIYRPVIRICDDDGDEQLTNIFGYLPNSSPSVFDDAVVQVFEEWDDRDAN